MTEVTPEPTLEIITFPREGDTSVEKSVIFGPDSPNFAFLLEVNPFTQEMSVTIGNAPPTSLLPTFIPNLLDEVATEFSGLAERPDFLNHVYGLDSE